MVSFVIEIQQKTLKNGIFFVVRDSRNGHIINCGSDTALLCKFIDSLTKDQE